MDITKHLVNEDLTILKSMEALNKAVKILFVTKGRHLLGSVTDGDIRRWILAGGSLDEPICKAMHQQPVRIKKDNRGNAKKIMQQYDLVALPIVNDNEEILDIIFWKDEIGPIKIPNINTPVVIMAGGKGKRLMPYTNILPKPLIPIGEKPIIEHVIDSFKKFGVKDFVLSINYKKNMLKAYFDDLEKDYNIFYLEEEKPLGTGGSLFYLKDKMKDTFFVSNCDILLNVNYESIYRFHKKHHNMITLITTLKRYTLPYGIINLTKQGYVDNLVEKPMTDYLVNTGVYVLEPEVLEFIKQDEFMHITHLIDTCLKNNIQVGTYPIGDDAWMDMGQFESLEEMKIKIEETV